MKRRRSYGPPVLITAAGIALAVAGVLIGTDAAVVIGLVFGMSTAAIGLVDVFAVATDRRHDRQAFGPRLVLSDREVDKILRERLTVEQRADIEAQGWTPNDPRDPYR